MANVVLEDVTKKFGGIIAVNDANLVVQDKEFVVLVGPSGCGKSTTLRMIAGLEEVTSGNIIIDDKDVTDLPPKDRDIAMVFQNYALYPHMNVYNNMAFGLKLRKFPKEDIEKRVKQAAYMLDIEQLLDRKPKQLSGGQRQRVALGRAIVREPKVFLMDEPLSNLDAKLRVQMRSELSKLHVRMQTTTIYVTHDQTEAMTMGDRIVVMRDGLIQQVGKPLEIYDSPNNVFVAGFIGSPAMNFFDDCVLINEGGEYWLKSEIFKVKLPKERAAKIENLDKYIDQEIILGVRPEDVKDVAISPNMPTDARFKAEVEVLEPMGSEIHLYLAKDDKLFIARVDAYSEALEGDEIEVAFDMRKVHLFDRESEERII